MSLPAGVMDELELRKYSQVLLMMGESIARNMYNCRSNSSMTPEGSNIGEHYQML